ncbi:MAG TPA: DUF1287 domain-containing protein [Bacteroidales bacterium]|nr:DUF1287 domain-containing protein [Bacteroidales bacterium]
MKKVNISILIFILSYHVAPGQKNFYERLSDSAIALTKVQVVYDPGYYVMDYPNGDVPADKGVCTDVIIRAYRKMGIDLQKEVHEDMIKNFKKYPDIWGLTHTDKNIDHRRVPNLMVFFTRHGTVKPITGNPDDFLPGDIVCWNLGGDVSHIGLVVNKKSSDGKRFMIVHNIGQGQVLEDCLFQHKITGHFRYNN